LRKSLLFVDRNSTPLSYEKLNFALNDHVVLLSYNELSQEIASFYCEQGEKVLLIDLDPEIHAHFQIKKNHNICARYADMEDPEVWEEFAFHKAKIVISCMIGGQDAEIQIARFLKERNRDVPF